jgi:MerR family mercuric resistance operon transcriptional regulator
MFFLDPVPKYGVYNGHMTNSQQEIGALTIGKLAKQSKVNIETIRFYERKHLINQPEKQGGFRYYSTDYVSRIRFIKRAQELGFTLKEIHELLSLSLEEHARCGDILARAQQKIDEIEQKISDLSNIKTSLEQLKRCCDNPNIPVQESSVLDTFKEEK